MLEQVVEALVRLLARPEPRELAHRPQPPPIHRGVDPTREGVLPGESDRIIGATDPLREVGGGVELADGLPGEGAEGRLGGSFGGGGGGGFGGECHRLSHPKLAVAAPHITFRPLYSHSYTGARREHPYPCPPRCT